MFRKPLAIIWKDVLMRFSSRSELLFFFILPVVFTAILGGGLSFGNDESRVRLPVVDLDSSPQSAQLIERLSMSTTVRPERVPADTADQFTAEDTIAGVLTIPAGFGEAASASGLRAGEPVELRLALDPANTYALVIEQAVRTAAVEMITPLQIAADATTTVEQAVPFEDDAARLAFFDAAQAQAATLPSTAADQVTYAVLGEGADFAYEAAGQASAGQLITWVLIPLLATAALMAYERTSGTLRRLLVTPSRKGTFLLGTLSGQLLMSLVQMALLVGFGAWVMGVNWGSSPAALAVMLVSFGLAGVAMGTMLGTFTRTDSQAGNLSIMLGMVMALLGGCWWPIELFPEGVRTAVKVLPTTWAMQGMTDITLRGQGLTGVWPEAAVLLGFAAVFFVIGVARFRYE